MMAQHATAAPPGWLTANEHRSNLVSTPGKRKADDELESQSNISSHFKKLRLNQNRNHITPTQSTLGGQPSSPSDPGLSFRPHVANTDARPALPVPVGETAHYPSHFDDQYPSSSQHVAHSKYGEDTTPQGQNQPYSHFANTQKPPSLSDAAFMTDRSPPHQTILSDRQREDEESMTVDETPNRIFITNLASEIAQIEADEAASKYTVFLPDIDKKVSALPTHLLNNNYVHGSHSPSSYSSLMSPTAAAASPSTALVLYRDPTSITVPEEEDAVRKAIIAARQRAREKSAEHVQRDREQTQQLHLGKSGGVSAGDSDIDLDDGDDDAMTDRSSHPDKDEYLDAMDIE